MCDRYAVARRSFDWCAPDRLGRSHGCLRLGVVLVLLAGLLSGCSSWPLGSEQRGLLPAEREEALGLDLLWPLPLGLGQPVKDIYLLPETLCVVGKDNTFVTIDPEKGYPLWEQFFDDNVYVRATEDEKNLYLIMGNRLLVVEKGMDKGGILKDIRLGFVATSAATVDAMYAYIGAGDRRLYAVEIGPRLGWQQTVGAAVTAQPQVDAAGAYFGAEDGVVYGVNLADGTRKWEFATDGPIVADLSIGRNVLYVGSTDGKLYALDTALGASRRQQQRWPLPYFAGGDIRQAPVRRGAAIYVVAEQTGVHAVQADDGTGLWQCPQADAFLAAGKDRVFLGVKGRRLICVDRDTGAVLWEESLPGGGGYRFVPNAYSDLIYICRERDGMLYCYQPR